MVAEEAKVALVVAMAVVVVHHLKDQPAKSVRRLGTTLGGARRGLIKSSSLKRSLPIMWQTPMDHPMGCLQTSTPTPMQLIILHLS
jgi:hypothetical protein